MTNATIYLGEIWHTPRAPNFLHKKDSDLEVFPRGALCVDANGKILAVGAADKVRAQFPQAIVEDFGNALLIPGFIDTHLHFPQLDIIGSHGEQLLGWLDTYTYPAESNVNASQAEFLAERFFTELIAHGTTTSCIYATSHLEPTEKLFAAAKRRGVRAVIGKVSMDRGAPLNLCQEADADTLANEQLICTWHGHENQLFVALTPRFAPTCSDVLLKSLGKLKERFPSVYVQTHHAETEEEVALVKNLFPKSATYLDVYHQYGLLGPRTILGHCIHVKDAEISRLKETQTRISHCPTSNLFLGSGLMPMNRFVDARINVSLGTDIGGGTSVSLWQTMNEAYKIQHLRGFSLSPAWLFYMATLGGAEALSLEATTGSFAPGKAADFQVLRPERNRLLKHRWPHTSPTERLFALIFQADDRLVEKVFIQGKGVSHPLGSS
jgi:guanine deaminase